MIPLDSFTMPVDFSRLSCTSRLQVESCADYRPTSFNHNSSPTTNSRRPTRYCSRLTKMTSSPETPRRRREVTARHVRQSILRLGTGNKSIRIKDGDSCRETGNATLIDSTLCLDSLDVSTTSCSLPSDPRQWSREDVRTWLTVNHRHLNVDSDRFPMNGKALCIMTPDMFDLRVPQGGATLYADFRHRLFCSVIRPTVLNGLSVD